MNAFRKIRQVGLGVGLALLMGMASTSTSFAEGDQPANGDIQAPHTADNGAPANTDTYSADEVRDAATKFFGSSSEGLAKAIEKAFADHGRPNAYIAGTEGGGAIVVGLRYGKGVLQYKGGDSQKVYWQGPSIGWDFGGNASKVFTLVYNLRSSSQLFQRFPAVDGSLYVVAGVGINYQKSGDIVLAPIRAGVGLRAGASLGYVHYTREASVIPL
ncbi:DUF1134 domain-containing protein [Solimonas terrae]|uniref:DUF1134 domain-containing protein n=1 Tax=Solimonas terrae TaxID=1396819 RepID=A0A6M2BTF2_9GAMM|nr:DUF1134 domain-containing protein [Solimonas terrae]NGY05393.1 DUF1134 domain-containing protein [Solimonas terrae]